MVSFRIISLRRYHQRRAALLIANPARNGLSINPTAIKQEMSFFLDPFRSDLFMCAKNNDE
jgi:hypothetical protein